MPNYLISINRFLIAISNSRTCSSFNVFVFLDRVVVDDVRGSADAGVNQDHGEVRILDLPEDRAPGHGRRLPAHVRRRNSHQRPGPTQGNNYNPQINSCQKVFQG